MSTENQLQVPAVITGKFNLSLTESKFQTLQDEADRLIFSEENLDAIKSFLDRCRKVEKGIEATHKDGKAEALLVGRQWDSAKNSFMEMVAAIKTGPQEKYAAICNDITRRQQEQEKERQRVAQIKQGIESNAILFANKIANAITTEELTAIERNINLEKSYKHKYQEFLQEAVDRFSQLNSQLADQKKRIKELEELRRQELEAQKKKDDEALLAIRAKQEEVTAQVEETKVVVQETAINQAVNSAAPVYAEEVLPQVKARRTTWKYEVLNINEVAKKSPHLVSIQINDDKVKEQLKTLKEAGNFDGKTEMVLNGIRFYEDKTF
jgi:DNA repair exonuclease SbcCD ATPase subunit